MVTIRETYAKLEQLSPERAQRVVAMIEDFSELEAIESAEDIAAANEAIARIKKGEKTVSLNELEKRLGL